MNLKEKKCRGSWTPAKFYLTVKLRRGNVALSFNKFWNYSRIFFSLFVIILCFSNSLSFVSFQNFLRFHNFMYLRGQYRFCMAFLTQA